MRRQKYQQIRNASEVEQCSVHGVIETQVRKLSERWLRFLRFVVVSALQDFIRTFKRLTIGSPRTPGDVFFECNILRGKWRITQSMLRGEGAGSQAFLTMNAIAFARASGLEYVHTPFLKIAHSGREAEWEALFNFGEGEARGVDAVGFTDQLGTTRLNERNFLERLTPEFRRKYYRGAEPRKNPIVVIAIHIRAGDVAPGHYMWSDPKTVLGALEKALTIAGSQSVVKIFSQGAPSNFADIDRNTGAEWYLDADPLWTMRELIEADVLVMAKSRFSYVAGILSDGVKIYQPYEEAPPLREWHIYQD